MGAWLRAEFVPEARAAQVDAQAAALQRAAAPFVVAAEVVEQMAAVPAVAEHREVVQRAAARMAAAEAQQASAAVALAGQVAAEIVVDLWETAAARAVFAQARAASWHHPPQPAAGRAASPSQQG